LKQSFTKDYQIEEINQKKTEGEGDFLDKFIRMRMAFNLKFSQLQRMTMEILTFIQREEKKLHILSEKNINVFRTANGADDSYQHEKEVGKLEEELKSLRWEFITMKKKKNEAEEKISELKEDISCLQDENRKLKEKLRMGIRRATVYFRDPQYKELDELCFLEGFGALVEVGENIAHGEYKVAHDFKILFTGQEEEDLCGLAEGVIKFCISNYHNGMYVDATSMMEHDCKKQWYLSDMAEKYTKRLGLNRILSFVDCGLAMFEDGTAAMIEPKLEFFERLTNNSGDGTDTMDDMLAAFAHFVFEESGRLYLPCDFQGDLINMLFTDPEINSVGKEESFLGIQTLGKTGVRYCLQSHLNENCISNKYCRELALDATLTFEEEEGSVY